MREGWGVSRDPRTIRVHIDHDDAVAMRMLHQPSLLLDLIEDISGRSVEIVPTASRAAVSLVFPYGVLESWRRTNRTRSVPPFGRTLEVLQGYIASESISRPLLVSYENLESSRWAWLGQELRETATPRLTCWPKDFDPGGERLPYWWNYVDWPELTRRVTDYPRYGRLYSLERLMSPLTIDTERLPRAILVTAHMPFMRQGAVRALSTWVDIDVLGGDVRPVAQKLSEMRRYQYAVVTENSLGVGYCTEKVPEAWDAGCVPLGYLQPPFSDFALPPETLLPDQLEALTSQPLLAQRPSLDRVRGYLEEVLE
jgi:hypothetical protein